MSRATPCTASGAAEAATRSWCASIRDFRTAEVDTLLGDPSKARENLGWTPSTTLEEIVAEMVAADKEEARKEALFRLRGFYVVGSQEGKA